MQLPVKLDEKRVFRLIMLPFRTDERWRLKRTERNVISRYECNHKPVGEEIE